MPYQLQAFGTFCGAFLINIPGKSPFSEKGVFAVGGHDYGGSSPHH